MMNKDVLDHIIKLTKQEKQRCEWGDIIQDGGKESALETYDKILSMLEKMKYKKK